jgi:hypothetical protein
LPDTNVTSDQVPSVREDTTKLVREEAVARFVNEEAVGN